MGFEDELWQLVNYFNSKTTKCIFSIHSETKDEMEEHLSEIEI